MPIVELHHPSPALDAAADVLGRGLGEGYVTAAGLVEHLGAGGLVCVAVAGEGSEVVLGAATADVLGEVEAGGLRSRWPEAAGRMAGPVGHLGSVAVAETGRRRGLGSALCGHLLGWLCEQGCSSVVGLSWRSGTADNSLGLLVRAGLEVWGEQESYWSAEQVAEGWLCPTCGGACRCAAVLVGAALPLAS